MTTTDHKPTVTIDGLEFHVDGDTAVLVKCDTALSEVTIPATVEGRPVTAVGDQAFLGCARLTSVELPPNVEIVGVQAFEGCTNLEEVFLPFRLKKIDARAFADCTQLREVPHYVWAGPRNDGKLLRNRVERSLPVDLRELGEECFADCASLAHMTVPYRVKTLPDSAFRGCTSLETVWLHNSLTEIGSRAFSDCPALRRLSVPASVQSIGSDAFDEKTQIVTPAGSEAAQYAQNNGLQSESGFLPDKPIISALGEDDGLSVSELLDSPELLEGFLNQYEVRPAVEEIERPEPQENATPIRPSRFRREDGIYRAAEETTPGDTVTITMVGDLMCGFRQQKTAYLNGQYDFTGNFEYVKPIFEKADLTLGNLEMTVAESYPYMGERLYADDRPHLNSPFAYLAAVRDAGFDAVLCAQNHMFDSGPKGVLETLKALNEAELIHGGMFADPRESRHLIFEVKGIRIGVVAYLDPARQLMKQANFAPEAISAMASHFDEGRISEDIAAAKAAGAEFILAYCHWGKEFTPEISSSQARYAQMVADAGADYIFGSHSHNPQHYRVIQAEDGREVPVVYSGGNFVSDIVRKPPTTQDSFISSLVLGRDSSGNVVVQGDGYLPCRIIDVKRRRGRFVTVPVTQLLDGELGYDSTRAAEDSQRIARAMRKEYRLVALSDAPTPLADSAPEDRPALPFAAGRPSNVATTVRDTEGRVANTYDLSAYDGLPKMGEANQVFQELALGYGLGTFRTGWKDVSVSDEEGNRLAFGIAYSEALSQMPEVIAGNKQLTRQFLHAAGVPAPRGRTFRMEEVDAALTYAREIGYPVVVKPVGGKSGQGVTAGITDEAGVKWAVEQIASGKRRRGRFILEEHVPGQDYRIFVAYGEVLSVIVRKPAFVLGDGKSTVKELVEAKNLIRRQNPHTQARLIKKNASSTYQLNKQGLGWDDVPEEGVEVLLAAAANISQGGDSTDVTGETHPSILKAAKEAAAAFPGLDQAGVDFLLADHRRDVKVQRGGICEINTIPALMANQVPVFGQAQPVADSVFRAAADDAGVQLDHFRRDISVSVRAQGAPDPEGLAFWIGTHARRLGLGGAIRETGEKHLRAYLSGPADRVCALVSNMFTGRPSKWPDWVRTVPVSRGLPASFVEDTV